jgi:hypothetical protein
MISRDEFERVKQGVLTCARFDRTGLSYFDESNRGFLISLVPMLGLDALLLLIGLAAGLRRAALVETLSLFCLILGMSVLSFTVARAWGLEARWGRYAVAMNWCMWVMQILCVVLLELMESVNGTPLAPVLVLLFFAFLLYSIALQFFLTRAGFDLGVGRAIIMMLLVNFGATLLGYWPILLAHPEAMP